MIRHPRPAAAGLVAIVLALAAASPTSAPAQAPAASQAPSAVKPPKALMYLTPADIAPDRILPPPPVDGSDLNKAELTELHRIIGARTAGRLVLAQWDDVHENETLYYPTIGGGFDLATLPATAEVLAVVRTDADLAASAAKAHFARKRPWAVDATIPTCDPDDKPTTAYPSGHATLGYSLGMTLAVLMPEKAEILMSRASEYAFSREVCGSHYASDVQASQVLAAAFVTALMKNPAFQAKLEASRAELRAAKFTK